MASKIKIIYGIRKCGKSTTLRLLKKDLLATRAAPDQLFFYEFEKKGRHSAQKIDRIFNQIQQKINPQKESFLIFDHIDAIKNWGKLIKTLYVNYNAQIYLSLSNKDLIELKKVNLNLEQLEIIHLLTLSFSEYMQFQEYYLNRKALDPQKELESYLKFGGFPFLHTEKYPSETITRLTAGLYYQILFEEVLLKNEIRDVNRLEELLHYVFENLGKAFSGKNIADHLAQQGKNIDVKTVYTYLKILENTFVLHSVSRYDLIQKKVLKIYQKQYVGDPSLINTRLGFNHTPLQGLLENMVYLELKRRGYKVYTGKLYQTEIHFVATNSQETLYIQVGEQIDQYHNNHPIIKPLTRINQAGNKYILLQDQPDVKEFQDIKLLSLTSFLLDEK